MRGATRGDSPSIVVTAATMERAEQKAAAARPELAGERVD